MGISSKDGMYDYTSVIGSSVSIISTWFQIPCDFHWQEYKGDKGKKE